MENNNINHPKHYSNSCSLEAIENMHLIFGDEAVYCFCLCNAYKYLWRYKNKNGIEDLHKAQWYINYCKKKCELNAHDFKTLRQHRIDLQKLLNSKLAMELQ